MAQSLETKPDPYSRGSLSLLHPCENFTRLLNQPSLTVQKITSKHSSDFVLSEEDDDSYTSDNFCDSD